MTASARFDHVGVTVADLDATTEFFVGLGLEVEGRMRSLCLEVADLQTAVAASAARGYSLVGGIGEYEDAWRMAYVRGPEGIIVALAQRVGQ